MESKTRVCIVSNSDPVEPVPGGIDAFVRGILSHAPDDLEFQLLGVSTNPTARPVRQWTECGVDDKSVAFFPILGLADPGKRHRIPVSLRTVISLTFRPPKFETNVLEFHRFELMWPFRKHPAKKTAFVHQNMKVLSGGVSDMRWKHAPGLYFWFEDRVVPRLDSLYAVREDAAEDYRQRYPALANNIHFCPTWFDPQRFFPEPAEGRQNAAIKLRETFGFPPDAQVITSVGRLDHQKDPMLLLAAFSEIQKTDSSTRLLFIGEGVLRSDLEREIQARGLAGKVCLAGLQKPAEIARHLNGSDVYCLSSVYEGMPISLLEALACGTPSVSTDAGEAKRVVGDTNGALVLDRTPSGLARSLQSVMRKDYDSGFVAKTVDAFMPQKVLEPIYENYRRLGR